MAPDPVFGGKMLVREAGQRNDKMILLVHGLGDEAGTTWNSVVGELSREYHVVAPDLPGFGGSSKANLLYSPHAYA
ncbi:MAG: alpha/beta fold hydrolase, partial [Deltaproteobacteria bacterium]|nr:alpha/beta fold hydrolase [Deltaproteobacteria bacterium]